MLASLRRLLLRHESSAKGLRGATYEVAFVDAMVAIDCSKYMVTEKKEKSGSRDAGKAQVLIALFSRSSDNGKEKLFPPCT
jgi:hypothetical protein